MGFDILGAAGNVLGAIDITSKVVDVATNALGLPPEVANAVKVGAGIVTGNPIMAANGAVGLAGNVLEKAAETEFAPSGAPGSGYANQRSSEPPSGSLNLSGQNGILGGIFDIYRGISEVDRSVTEKFGELLLDGKNEAGFKALNNELHRKGVQFAATALGIPQVQAQFESQYACKVDPKTASEGKVGFKADYSGDWTNKSSPLDPNITKYREAIDVLRANFETFDTAASANDGLLTRADLAQVAGNQNASQQMRSASQFLLDNPEYFNRLEMAANIGGKDGLIGFIDLTSEVKRVNAEIKQYGLPEASDARNSAYEGASSSVSTGGSKMSSILNDPNMSLEEKVQAMIDSMMSNIDGELGEVMTELDKAYSKKVDGKDNNAVQSKQGSIEKLQRKLQQLMERRRQMVELASNMSKNFNDMAMAAIRNMK